MAREFYWTDHMDSRVSLRAGGGLHLSLVSQGAQEGDVFLLGRVRGRCSALIRAVRRVPS